MLRHRFTFKRRRTPPQVRTIFMISLVLVSVLVMLSIWLIDKGIKPTLMYIAEQKTTEFATRSINSAVKFAEDYEFEDIADLGKDDNGAISIVGWDSTVVNEIKRATTDRVEEFFHSMNKGEMPDYEDPLNEPEEYDDSLDNLSEQDPTLIEIPIGQATGNSVLANLGPKIPVNLELVGSVQTDIIEEREEWGINNVVVTLYVVVEADVQIVIPFTTEMKNVSSKIMIDKHLVMGNVPEFYGGGDGDPSISVPKEDFQDDQ